jgi:hypothetical protein
MHQAMSRSAGSGSGEAVMSGGSADLSLPAADGEVAQLQSALALARAELAASRALTAELQRGNPEAAALLDAAVKREQALQEVRGRKCGCIAWMGRGACMAACCATACALADDALLHACVWFAQERNRRALELLLQRDKSIAQLQEQLSASQAQERRAAADAAAAGKRADALAAAMQQAQADAAAALAGVQQERAEVVSRLRAQLEQQARQLEQQARQLEEASQRVAVLSAQLADVRQQHQQRVPAASQQPSVQPADGHSVPLDAGGAEPGAGSRAVREHDSAVAAAAAHAELVSLLAERDASVAQLEAQLAAARAALEGQAELPGERGASAQVRGPEVVCPALPRPSLACAPPPSRGAPCLPRAPLVPSPLPQVVLLQRQLGDALAELTATTERLAELEALQARTHAHRGGCCVCLRSVCWGVQRLQRVQMVQHACLVL